jgi:hypothetical protein
MAEQQLDENRPDSNVPRFILKGWQPDHSPCRKLNGKCGERERLPAAFYLVV